MSKNSAKSEEYRRTVFLNYPYHHEYARFAMPFYLQSFAVAFTARSAEEEHGSLKRLDRIVDLVNISAHGIHDLSMLPSEQMPRLNMPFELGVFYGAKRLGGTAHKAKSGFAFDREHHRHHRALFGLRRYRSSDPQVRAYRGT